MPTIALPSAIHVALLITAALTPVAALAQPSPEPAESTLPTPPVDREALLKRLQQGGLILLIRHERTELPSRPDDYTRAPEECRAQRNLSLAGVAGSQETGFVLRMLAIPVGRVITSPMCRSAETARFMFGTGYETDTRLMHHDPDPEGGRDLEKAVEELREMLREIAPGEAGTNIALISHGGNIVKVSDLRLSEGEIGVLELDESGTATALGQFMGSDLSVYARRKMMAESGGDK
ncbi:MAG: hypothetical protein AAF494_02650 [Pseudomonadota bacterium]